MTNMMLYQIKSKENVDLSQLVEHIKFRNILEKCYPQERDYDLSCGFSI